MSAEVKHIFGGPTGQREVNALAVHEAEALLEAVNAGEVIGLLSCGCTLTRCRPIGLPGAWAATA